MPNAEKRLAMLAHCASDERVDHTVQRSHAACKAHQNDVRISPRLQRIDEHEAIDTPAQSWNPARRLPRRFSELVRDSWQDARNAIARRTYLCRRRLR